MLQTPKFPPSMSVGGGGQVAPGLGSRRWILGRVTVYTPHPWPGFSVLL